MNFSPQSKVWIYQSNRAFTPVETEEIKEQLNTFVAQWAAHGHALKAKGELLHHYFIVLVVDQEQAPVTGCSIDSSVRFIKSIEERYGVDMFNRFNIAYRDGSLIHVQGKEDFETLITIKKITSDTIVFNNMVQSLAEFEQGWEVPIAQSWHQQVFADQLNA